MKSRATFPLDLAALLFFPVIVIAVSLLLSSIFPILNWLPHTSALSWLWALGLATGTSVCGIVLLFIAKLPQYRSGIFLRVGSRHLPPRHQQLYRVSFWLIVPSIIALLGLLSAVHHFQ